MSDEEIISLFFARDEQALVYTEAKYGPYCFTLANAILPIREDAEETVSDTYLKAWQTIPPKRPSVLRMFLAKITRNLAFSRWRNLTAQKRGSGALPLVLEELEECVGAGEDPETILEAKELTRTIAAFLDALPKWDANVFLRRYFFLEDASAISARYGLRRDAVNQSLSRTRKKLKAHLIQEGYAL